MACPLWPIHIVVMYILTLCPVWFLCTGFASAFAEATWNVTFSPAKVEQLVEETDQTVYLWTSSPLGPDYANGKLEIVVSDYQIAQVVNSSFVSDTNSNPSSIYLNTSSTLTSLPLNLSFALRGKFLGYTNVAIRATGSNKKPSMDLKSDPLSVSVIRPPTIEDKVFIYSVAILMGLNYVNMGSTLDMDAVKGTLKRPIGPAVGLLSQYIFMPLISFGLSYAMFSVPALRLGLFTSGCSPGGGASNMWTYLLEGNLNLSITMTFFSNVFAIATMPLWLFTLGRVIFEASNITIPYTNIVSYIIVLVIPVGIGVLFQVYLPQLSKFCRRILGPFSVAMIVFIVVFGIYTNLFMFKVFTWQMFLAGFSVPLLGYLFGALAARLLRFPIPDVTAISVETGVQNTGIAIVLLRLTLPQPDADLTSVIPVALATMTPIPLLIALVIFKIHKRRKLGKRPYSLAISTPSSDDETIKIVRSPDENGSANSVPSITITNPHSPNLKY